MRYRYYLCDVFSDVRFGGNQLAVVPEAEGLSDEQMLQIAREFNFSETTFVSPPRSLIVASPKSTCASPATGMRSWG